MLSRYLLLHGHVRCVEMSASNAGSRQQSLSKTGVLNLAALVPGPDSVTQVLRGMHFIVFAAKTDKMACHIRISSNTLRCIQFCSIVLNMCRDVRQTCVFYLQKMS